MTSPNMGKLSRKMGVSDHVTGCVPFSYGVQWSPRPKESMLPSMNAWVSSRGTENELIRYPSSLQSNLHVSNGIRRYSRDTIMGTTSPLNSHRVRHVRVSMIRSRGAKYMHSCSSNSRGSGCINCVRYKRYARAHSITSMYALEVRPQW